MSALTLADNLRRDVSGQWTDNRLEQANHYRGVIYVAIRAIMDAVLSCTVQINRKHRHIHQTSLRLLEKALPTPSANSEDEQFRPFDDPAHSLVRLVDTPNRTETFNELLAQLVLQYQLTGSGLLWGNPNDFGLPAELYILPTALCYPQPADPNYPEGWWRVQQYYPSGGYGILPSPMAGGGAAVDARDIFVFKNPHPLWRWDAMSPLTAGAVQLDILESIDQARWTAMECGLTPDMVLLAPGVSQPQLDVYLERLKQTNIGKRGHRKVLAVGGDQGDSKYDVKFPSTSPKDMDFSTGWDQMTAYALALFGVPKSVAGLATTGSYAELYAAIKQFHTLTLRPMVARLGDWLTRHLAHIWSRDLAIQLDLPTIDDQQLHETQLQTDLAHDGLTYNEYRALRGRKPLPGGDVLVSVYVQQQQAKAQQALQAAQQPQQPPAGGSVEQQATPGQGEQPSPPNAQSQAPPAGPGGAQPDQTAAAPAPGDEGQPQGDQLSQVIGTAEPGSGEQSVRDLVTDQALGALGVPRFQQNVTPSVLKGDDGYWMVSALGGPVYIKAGPPPSAKPPRTKPIATPTAAPVSEPAAPAPAASDSLTKQQETAREPGEQYPSPSGKLRQQTAEDTSAPAPAPRPAPNPFTAPPAPTTAAAIRSGLPKQPAASVKSGAPATQPGALTPTKPGGAVPRASAPRAAGLVANSEAVKPSSAPAQPGAPIAHDEAGLNQLPAAPKPLPVAQKIGSGVPVPPWQPVTQVQGHPKAAKDFAALPDAGQKAVAQYVQAKADGRFAPPMPGVGNEVFRNHLQKVAQRFAETGELPHYLGGLGITRQLPPEAVRPRQLTGSASRQEIINAIRNHPDVQSLPPAQRLRQVENLSKMSPGELIQHAKNLGVAHPELSGNLTEGEVRRELMSQGVPAAAGMRSDDLYKIAEQSGVVPPGHAADLKSRLLEAIEAHPEFQKDPLTPEERQKLQGGSLADLTNFARRNGVNPDAVATQKRDRIPTVPAKPPQATAAPTTAPTPTPAPGRQSGPGWEEVLPGEEVPPVAPKEQLAAMANADQLPPKESFAAHAKPLSRVVAAHPMAAQTVARVNEWADAQAAQHAQRVAEHFGIPVEKAQRMLARAITAIAEHAAVGQATGQGIQPVNAQLGHGGQTLPFRFNARTQAARKIVNDIADHLRGGNTINGREAAETARAIEHLPPDEARRAAASLQPGTVKEAREDDALAKFAEEHSPAGGATYGRQAYRQRPAAEPPPPDERRSLLPSAKRAVAAGLAGAVGAVRPLESSAAGVPHPGVADVPRPAMVASAPALPRPGHELEPPTAADVRRPEAVAAEPPPQPASATSPPSDVKGGEAATRAGAAEAEAIWSHAAANAPKGMDKKQAKAFVENLPAPSHLPDSPADYFKVDEADKVVPLSQIKNLRARPEGIENAAKFMEASRRGIMPKRGPLNVVENGDGTFTVADGNSTFANAKINGWKELPIKVVPLEELHKEQRKTIDKEHAKASARLASDKVFDPEELALPKKGVESGHDTKDSLYAAAQAEKPHFDRILDAGEGVEKALGARVVNTTDDAEFQRELDKPGPIVRVGSIKGEKRAAEKVNADYGGHWNQLHDILRATVGVDTAADVPKAVAALKAELAKKGWKIAKQPKNRFAKPTLEGYSDFLLNVVGPGGVVSEVQVHLKGMLKAKEEVHKLYEKERSITAKMKTEGRSELSPGEKAELARLVNEQRDIFGSAWLRSLGLHSGGGMADGVQLEHLKETWAKQHAAAWGQDLKEMGAGDAARNEPVSGGEKVPDPLRPGRESGAGAVGQPAAGGSEERPVGGGVRPAELHGERRTDQPGRVQEAGGVGDEQSVRDYLDQLRRTREDFLSRGKSTKSIDRQIEDWSRVAKSLDATAALLARVRKIIGQN